MKGAPARAIQELVEGVERGDRHQVLLGVQHEETAHLVLGHQQHGIAQLGVVGAREIAAAHAPHVGRKELDGAETAPFATLAQVLRAQSDHLRTLLLANLPDPIQPTDTAFYLEHAVKACEGGVERVHIVPYSVDGSVLMESFTHDGVGTMIVDEKLESLREATADDIGGVLQLIEPFERNGTLVKRDRTEIERDIGLYTVIEHDGVIFGCAALYPYPDARTAEMAALTVSPNVQSQGDGERILKRVEQRAKMMGLESIFVLTTQTMHWFLKRGFAQVDPDWLPEARKRKYNWDRRSQVLVKKLT